MARLENVPAREAPRLLAEGVQVVDVREHHELRHSRLDGARHIPLGELAHRLGELERHRPVALLCRSGSRSAVAAALLARHGFERVINLAGGIVALERHLCVGRETSGAGDGAGRAQGPRDSGRARDAGPRDGAIPVARAARWAAWLRRSPAAGGRRGDSGGREVERATPR
jgi:rhodanese-related sulfurtransferase